MWQGWEGQPNRDLLDSKKYELGEGRRVRVGVGVGQPQDNGSKAGLGRWFIRSVRPTCQAELRLEDIYCDESGREGVLSDLCGGRE